MKGNQLFSTMPPIEFVEKITKLFGPDGFDEHYYFTLIELEKKGTIEKLTEFIPELKKYYLACKADKYLINITPKRAITILRQLLRPHKYRIVGFEKYANGVKFLLYKLEKDVPLEPAKYGLIMDFD